MEYLIVVGVSFIFGGVMVVALCRIMFLAGMLEKSPYDEDEQAADDAALDTIRGELAMWKGVK